MRLPLTSIEICAGAGGQALGLEQAGFEHLAVVELDRHACATLRTNRPYWDTIREDVTRWNASQYRGKVSLLAGGVPCPPFSKAGRQLGADDERDLFPAALDLVEQCDPDAVMLENVRGLLENRFDEYRAGVEARLSSLGFVARWKLLNASDFGVPQLRPRTILVALKEDIADCFDWPKPSRNAPTVGDALREQMALNGWERAAEWASRADRIAPTIVGGSMKHGGPDLGPTRAKREWATIGVNAHLVGEAPPPPGFDGNPTLTVTMAAILQGFPADWIFAGKKTNAYRQVGNAFPPPVARAVGLKIAQALRAGAARRAVSESAGGAAVTELREREAA